MGIPILSVTQLINLNEDIKFVFYADGGVVKVENKIETETNMQELEELINTGKYYVLEIPLTGRMTI